MIVGIVIVVQLLCAKCEIGQEEAIFLSERKPIEKKVGERSTVEQIQVILGHQ